MKGGIDARVSAEDRAERSATDLVDTSSVYGRAISQLLAVIAEWEHGTIVDRTAAGKRRGARDGKWPGGQVRFGHTSLARAGAVHAYRRK
jgi:DNA invertase Pin-like site-specific DNA recombinase